MTDTNITNLRDRPSVLADWAADVRPLDEDIRATIGHAVSFALSAILLIAISNGALFALTFMAARSASHAFAVGLCLAATTAVLGFFALQAEQVARIAHRDATAMLLRDSAEAYLLTNRSLHAWRLVGAIRVGAIICLFGSLACLASGLYLV